MVTADKLHLMKSHNSICTSLRPLCSDVCVVLGNGKHRCLCPQAFVLRYAKGTKKLGGKASFACYEYCLNEGICHLIDEISICFCNNGFVGDRCEQKSFYKHDENSFDSDFVFSSIFSNNETVKFNSTFSSDKIMMSGSTKKRSSSSLNTVIIIFVVMFMLTTVGFIFYRKGGSRSGIPYFTSVGPEGAYINLVGAILSLTSGETVGYASSVSFSISWAQYLVLTLQTFEHGVPTVYENIRVVFVPVGYGNILHKSVLTDSCLVLEHIS
ncbi:hypothetical protein HELRODRAFT_165066 [Helobdella robusta]|uniref:EGF-like domain-containing protein n=1 Tax=Helobdella robusta TaxID=6412 RepID=T1EW87_HELRO|nr:hypothetical protein HELRODRAFT_165066 [Helobdella robusta]ESN92930.1 hypothetical protein HELRODRAFT_165066 [Helobdella robusta]